MTRLPSVTALITASVTVIAALLMLVFATATVSAQETITVESSNPYSGDENAITEGNKLYFKYCASCHGGKADGVNRWGAYAGNLTKFWRGYGEFIAIVSVGRPKKGMPPWAQFMTGEQISWIGAYLETLAIKGANWK